MILSALLLLQSDARELLLSVKEGAEFEILHKIEADSESVELRLKYRVESVDPARQHSGLYRADGLSFRSGSHG
jgi:hypothetical protein